MKRILFAVLLSLVFQPARAQPNRPMDPLIVAITGNQAGGSIVLMGKNTACASRGMQDKRGYATGGPGSNIVSFFCWVAVGPDVLAIYDDGSSAAYKASIFELNSNLMPKSEKGKPAERF